jgi:hypothetical protein
MKATGYGIAAAGFAIAAALTKNPVDYMVMFSWASVMGVALLLTGGASKGGGNG